MLYLSGQQSLAHLCLVVFISMQLATKKIQLSTATQQKIISQFLHAYRNLQFACSKINPTLHTQCGTYFYALCTYHSFFSGCKLQPFLYYMIICLHNTRAKIDNYFKL